MTTAERRQGREWKRIELQLDTAQILIVLAMLFGLCATSFYLGRWIERDRWSEGAPKSAAAPKIVDSGAGDLTFFDTLGRTAAEPARQARGAPAASGTPAPRNPGNVSPPPAGADAAEGPDVEPASPAMKAMKPTTPMTPMTPGSASAGTGPSQPAARPASPGRSTHTGSGSSPAGGSYAVQVFAGDRSQAEKVASQLARKGYSARVVAGASAGTARVRVVGYRSKNDATQAAARLKKEANLKPWVLKAD